MEIAFHNGSIYRYFGVPPHVHEALLCASSKGRYFNAAIRSSFRFERLQNPPSPGPVSRQNSSLSRAGAVAADDVGRQQLTRSSGGPCPTH
jgi:hypothetical protein